MGLPGLDFLQYGFSYDLVIENAVLFSAGGVVGHVNVLIVVLCFPEIPQ
jgi:hypothetical protein